MLQKADKLDLALAMLQLYLNSHTIPIQPGDPAPKLPYPTPKSSH